jgi:hypothetical protein
LPLSNRWAGLGFIPAGRRKSCSVFAAAAGKRPESTACSSRNSMNIGHDPTTVSGPRSLEGSNKAAIGSWRADDGSTTFQSWRNNPNIDTDNRALKLCIQRCSPCLRRRSRAKAHANRTRLAVDGSAVGKIMGQGLNRKQTRFAAYRGDAAAAGRLGRGTGLSTTERRCIGFEDNRLRLSPPGTSRAGGARPLRARITPALLRRDLDRRHPPASLSNGVGGGSCGNGGGPDRYAEQPGRAQPIHGRIIHDFRMIAEKRVWR